MNKEERLAAAIAEKERRGKYIKSAEECHIAEQSAKARKARAESRLAAASAEIERRTRRKDAEKAALAAEAAALAMEVELEKLKV